MKKILSILVAMSLLALNGCTMTVGIDTLLSPPKLTQEQNEIYQALLESTSANSKIKLKYPKSGTNLSAFVIEDIDNDEGDEALVFYENIVPSAEDSSLRIGLLDKKDGKWEAICDIKAQGKEIEKVIISPIGKSDTKNIVIGYSMVTQGDKGVYVYSYNENMLNQTFPPDNFDSSYEYFDVRDILGDGNKNLMIITKSNASSKAGAKLVSLTPEDVFEVYTIPFSNEFSDYKQMIYSISNTKISGIYFDGTVSPNSISTEILRVEDGRIFKPKINNVDDIVVNLERSYDYLSMDIDGDGDIEIPVQSVFLGYENLPQTEQINSINWMCYDEKVLKIKYISYYSINEGYAYVMPDRWIGLVTVKNDPQSGEVVFYEYGGSLFKSKEELLRISVIKKSEGDVPDDYEVVHSNEEYYYLAKIPNSDNSLVPTMSEVSFSFKYID